MGILVILGSLVIAGFVGQPGIAVLGIIIGVAIMRDDYRKG